MKKLLIAIIGLALFGMGFVAGGLKDSEQKEILKEYHLVENDKVKIEYWDVENGEFDIVVTPKGEFNVMAEFPLDESKYYQDAYLIGKTKQQAEDHCKKVSERFGKTWDFSWGN